jgi:site-specific recombinase
VQQPASSADVPELEVFAQKLAPNHARHRAFRQLHALLASARVERPQAERVELLEQLARWLCSRRRVPRWEATAADERVELTRLRWLLRALETNPGVRARFAHVLGKTLAECSGGGLFGRLGLPTDRGFFADTVDRISRGLLPEPVDEYDLAQLVGRLFPDPRALRVLQATPPELIAELSRQLRASGAGVEPWSPLFDHLLDACSLLALRISSTGLSDVIRARSPKCRLSESPFFRLPRAVDALLDGVRRHRSSASGSHQSALYVREQLDHCHELMQNCRDAGQAVVENLEHYGVSVDVVFRLELISRSQERLALLLRQLEPYSELTRAAEAKSLLAELVSLRLSDRKLSDIARSNLHLLARKIIERAGHTGEHYITASRGEYLKMLLSAGGGGVLTAGTTALKFLIGWAHFAPFAEGMLSAANYAGSFILMQLLGFTLATKQPSMTAAALAGTLRASARHPDLSALVSLIARIVRSQLAAAIGNIGMVIPAAVALDQLFRHHHDGLPFLDPKTAEYVLGSLHPTSSGTVFYAALTGVLLWASSIAAGWLENWAVYRRLPEAIAAHRSGRWLGRRTLRFAARFFGRNIAGFGGNTTLGVLLGMTPVMGKFFGLPLDVRHVTLSTGALTLSVCSLGMQAATSPATLWAAAGILVIGTLNFGVSFVLALGVALRARDVARSDLWRLIKSVLATFVRSPLQFFVPPAHPADADVHGPVSVPPPAA